MRHNPSTVILSEITEQRVKELYFDNSEFAYNLIRLITQRLVANTKSIKPRPSPPSSSPARNLPKSSSESAPA